MTRKKITADVVQAAFDAVKPAEGGRGFADRVGPEHPLPAYETTRPLEHLTRQVLLEYIDLDPDQPRTTMDEQELADLAQSIREVGVLQYVTLQKVAESNRYRVVAGHRRVLAARQVGLEAIPAVIRPESYDEKQRSLEQLAENIQRADLAPLEAARALTKFMERYGYSQQQAAKRLGKPRSFVVELVSILKVPDDLLRRAGVDKLPKQTLVEVSRAPASEQAALLDHALAGSPLREVKERRTNRRADPRVVYYRERFQLEGQPPIEIRWMRDPDDVTPEKLVEALGQVARHVAGRPRP